MFSEIDSKKIRQQNNWNGVQQANMKGKVSPKMYGEVSPLLGFKPLLPAADASVDNLTATGRCHLGLFQLHCKFTKNTQKKELVYHNR